MRWRGSDPRHIVDEYGALQQFVPGCSFVVLEGMPNNTTDTAPGRAGLLQFLQSPPQ